MNRKTPIDTYTENRNGEEVEIKVYKPKKAVKKNLKPKTTAICPECNSTIKVNTYGVWECTGDQLEYWHQQFCRFRAMSENKQKEFIETISDLGKFMDLYSRWQNSQELDNYEFDCGYSNKIFSPSSRHRVTIPDPIQVKHIERRLGRKLTEEELHNEDAIWEYSGQYLEKYRDGAKKVKIKHVAIPEDV